MGAYFLYNSFFRTAWCKTKIFTGIKAATVTAPLILSSYTITQTVTLTLNASPNFNHNPNPNLRVGDFRGTNDREVVGGKVPGSGRGTRVVYRGPGRGLHYDTSVPRRCPSDPRVHRPASTHGEVRPTGPRTNQHMVIERAPRHCAKSGARGSRIQDILPHQHFLHGFP